MKARYCLPQKGLGYYSVCMIPSQGITRFCVKNLVKEQAQLRIFNVRGLYYSHKFIISKAHSMIWVNHY